MADPSFKSGPSKTPPVGEIRLPGMDHDLYPYRTLDDAPRFIWPNGARLALTITLMLEYRELEPPADRDKRIVNPLGDFKPDWLTWSQHAYGNRVGIFRILEILDRFGLTPSVALGAEAARRHPELVDECLRRGATFLAHGTFATRRISSLMSPETQRAHIAESRAAVIAATGQTPTGWCGQDFNETPETPTLLAEAGYTYTTDWSNDDRPYRLGPILSLPAQSDWNDLEAMWLRRVSPQAWSAMLIEGARFLHSETGAVCNITLHPWITGQAHRIRYLADALAGILGQPDIWRTSLDEVAKIAADQL
jgi:peptidoglycan/xylan/chitin deacetylase (PgdA/CDA1 family)